METKHVEPTVAEKFDMYLLEDHNEAVLLLLKRVCMVRLEPMKIINKM